jgi:arylsulfatase A-like enzyme
VVPFIVVQMLANRRRGEVPDEHSQTPGESSGRRAAGTRRGELGDLRAARGRRRLAAAVVAALVFGGCGSDSMTAGTPERIVLIVVDTLRRDHLSPYGAEVATPNIARLAREGIVHRNAIASFHMTSMSMGALWSGRTPALSSGDPSRAIAWNESNWCGMARFGPAAGACFPANVPLLGSAMRDLDYETIGVTANSMLFGAAGFSQGFDQWLEVPDSGPAGKRKVLAQTWQQSSAARAAPAVIAAVERALAKRDSDRFFLYVHFMDVHDWAARKVSYRQTVEEVDDGIGRLLALLEAEGLLEGSAIVFTSDHGESLDEPHLVPTTPRHIGNPSFEPVLAVPLIVKGLDFSHAGPIVRSEDLFRILVRTAGGTPPDASDLEPEELFVTEQAYRTYRRGRWKSFSGRYDGTFRLVDLEADPSELRDVAAQHPDIAALHSARVSELTAALAAPNAPLHDIDEVQMQRLRSLGYIE